MSDFQLTDLTRGQFDAIVWQFGVEVFWIYVNGAIACAVTAIAFGVAGMVRARDFMLGAMGNAIGTCLFGFPTCWWVIRPLVWWSVHE